LCGKLVKPEQKGLICVTDYVTLTNEVTKRLKHCLFCEKQFEVNPRGRARVYCSRSHRQRAHEERKSAELKEPSLKQFRLLNERLATLARQRRKWAWRDETVAMMLGRDPRSVRRSPAYERSVSIVRALLIDLAPEVLTAPQPGSAPGWMELTRSSKVFRRLATEHHPDHSGNDEVMKAVNELWQALKADVDQASAHRNR
jgi:hypothetical protein